MKAQNQRAKKKRNLKKKDQAPKKTGKVDSKKKTSQQKPVKQKTVRTAPKRPIEKKSSGERSISKYFSMGSQFLREAKTELKKVKWPTRKELLASTAVVIVLTLLVAFYLGLVDFGLIKIIKNVVG